MRLFLTEGGKALSETLERGSIQGTLTAWRDPGRLVLWILYLFPGIEQEELISTVMDLSDSKYSRDGIRHYLKGGFLDGKMDQN